MDGSIVSFSIHEIKSWGGFRGWLEIDPIVRSFIVPESEIEERLHFFDQIDGLHIGELIFYEILPQEYSLRQDLPSELSKDIFPLFQKNFDAVVIPCKVILKV